MGVVALLALPFMSAAHVPINSTVEGETATQIAKASVAAMKKATSFHVNGQVKDQGTEAFNLSLSKTGGGGSVSVNGATLQVVVAKGTLYIKADEKSWLKLTGSSATAELVANKWIKVPATNADFKDFADLTITKDFTSQFLTGLGTVSLVPGTTTFHGHEAVVLTDPQGDKLYVAATGTPYILRIQAKGAGGELTFSDFGDAPLPAVPTNAITLPGA
jgi:hypothetical protein